MSLGSEFKSIWRAYSAQKPSTAGNKIVWELGSTKRELVHNMTCPTQEVWHEAQERYWRELYTMVVRQLIREGEIAGDGDIQLAKQSIEDYQVKREQQGCQGSWNYLRNILEAGQ